MWTRPVPSTKEKCFLTYYKLTPQAPGRERKTHFFLGTRKDAYNGVPMADALHEEKPYSQRKKIAITIVKGRPLH